MMLRKDISCLLLIDVQEKLTPLIVDHQQLIHRSVWLSNLAKDLDIPQIISEQYPAGLGATINQLNGFSAALPKIDFSCWRDPLLRSHMQGFNKKQWILIGI